MLTKIGRYEIIKELGQGGMATVYLGRDPSFSREVALKVLPREFLHDKTFQKRFELEARTIASLEHGHIVPVYDFGQEDGQPYLVMRYMKGGSLADRLDKGPLTPAETAAMLATLADALDLAHKAGVVHRDLKPANILFDEHGKPFLSDFGIVKIAEETSTFTGSGVVGTPAYMSPEQVAGEGRLDGRSDIYALGVIAFEMLSGKQPYTADTPMRLAMKHVLEPVPDISAARPDLPKHIRNAISRALSKERAQRFATAREFAEALAGADAAATEAIEIEASAPETEVFSDEPAKRDAAEHGEKARRDAPGVPWMPSRGWLAGGALMLALLVWGLNAARNAARPPATTTPESQQADAAAQEVLAETASVRQISTSAPTISSNAAQPSAENGVLVFASRHDGDWEIYSVNLDGAGVSRLTDVDSVDSDPAWSDDGSQLAFYSSRGGSHSIYVMNADGSQVERITNDEGSDFSPDWSPDGRIAFYSDRAGINEIFVVGDDGSDLTRLTFNSAEDYLPAWSPDGSRIAFVSARNGNPDIYVVDVNTLEETQITAHPAGEEGPAWSPDGSRIAFASDRTGNWEIYTMDSSGGNTIQLTSGSQPNQLPAWSPDGEWIAFVRGSGNELAILMMRTDGTDVLELVDFNARTLYPDWRP